MVTDGVVDGVIDMGSGASGVDALEQEMVHRA
jgi:hypothetical protein